MVEVRLEKKKNLYWAISDFKVPYGFDGIKNPVCMGRSYDEALVRIKERLYTLGVTHFLVIGQNVA